MTQKIYIDVREPDEYHSEHIPNSLNIPLSSISTIKNYQPLLAGKEVCLVCKSGMRAGMAKNTLDAHNIACEIYVGGIEQWKAENKPVMKHRKPRMSIFRQVQVVVGFAVATLSILGATTLNVKFIWAAAAIGTALGIAGLFGFCLLAQILSKMPWNRVHHG